MSAASSQSTPFTTITAVNALRHQGRARAYRLFSQLFLRPVSAELFEVLKSLPELGSALGDSFDSDAASVAHHTLFGLQVPPWAGVFVSADGCIGGSTATAVREFYRRAAMPLDDTSDEADHIGHILWLLAALEHQHQGNDDDVLEAAILDGVLLPWLPTVVETIERHADPFYRALAGLTLDLAIEHRSSLITEAPEALTLTGDEPDSLTLDDAGLQDLAVFLVTPASSGLFLSREDVRRIASRQRLPIGFGSRAQALENLLRSAAEYGQLGQVVDDLGSLVTTARINCRQLADSGIASLVVHQGLRESQLSRTSDVLARLRQVSTEPGEGPVGAQASQGGG